MTRAEDPVTRSQVRGEGGRVTVGHTNWAGNIAFHATDVHAPTSLAELQALVARAERVRPIGTAHSFNDIADTSGILVSAARLPARIELDSAAGTVRVGAGVRYAELAGHLHERGYALHNLASLPHISVVGSCATATHGSGVANGGLATAVTEIELLTATGDLVRLRRGRDDDFAGAVVGLGALGMVVSLTLAVEPTFTVRQRVYERLPPAALTEHFTEIMSGAYSVSLFTRWADEWVDQVWVKARVADRGEAVDTGEHDEEDEAAGRGDWFGALPAREPRHPVIGLDPAACTAQLGRPGPWHLRLPHFRPEFTPSVGAELQSEYLLPREHAVPALRALHDVRDRIHPVVQVCEVRTVASDDLWLSQAYRRDVVAIHFTWVKDEAAVLPVVGLVERRLAPFDPLPHWGKIFTLSPAKVRRGYERLPDFTRLMRRLDPAGKFTNAFARRYLEP